MVIRHDPNDLGIYLRSAIRLLPMLMMINLEHQNLLPSIYWIEKQTLKQKTGRIKN